MASSTIIRTRQKFVARKSLSQGIPSGTNTLVTFESVIENIGTGTWNNNIYSIGVSGDYTISSCLQFFSVPNLIRCVLDIHRNDSLFSRLFDMQLAPSSGTVGFSSIAPSGTKTGLPLTAGDAISIKIDVSTTDSATISTYQHPLPSIWFLNELIIIREA
jgi:hypothetical protein